MKVLLIGVGGVGEAIAITAKNQALDAADGPGRL